MPVEPLSKSDLDAIFLIEQASYPDPWDREMLSSAWTQPYYGGIKFVSDGEICGYLIALTVPPEVEILNISVAPNFRRQGIARKMMTRTLEDGRRQGCVQVYLEVRASNTPAIKLYESLGFTVIYTRQKYYRDGEEGLVMRARL